MGGKRLTSENNCKNCTLRGIQMISGLWKVLIKITSNEILIEVS